MRRAQLIAEAVAVLCPFCGDVQPNRTGSEMWTMDDFELREATRAKARDPKRQTLLFTCVSCEARFILARDTKVMFR